MNPRSIFQAVCAVAALQLLPSPLFAENWPSWRGPTGVGISTESSLPLHWDGKTGEGVLWKISLKGSTGHSRPIVWKDRVFVTTSVKQTKEQETAKEIPEHHLLCLQTADGKQIWSTPIPPGKMTEGYDIYAAPTPATDGKAVCCWFGSAVMAAVDFDGKLLWRKEYDGPFLSNTNLLNPGICSSPIVYEKSVILLFDLGAGKGYLQALDKKTGEVKWTSMRTKSSHNNSTPFVIETTGRKELIVSGPNAVEGIDPATGDPIWSSKCSDPQGSAAFGGNLICAGKEPMIAVDPSGAGDVTKTNVKWSIPKVPGEYSSPVICGDFVYRVRTEGIVGCRRLATGEEAYVGRLPGVSKLSSPVATPDGFIYFVSTGKSYVIKTGDTLEILASNDLGGGGNGSSPAISGGRIFVRDSDWLYCIGGK